MITRERKAREAVAKELAELRLKRRIAEEVRNAVEERQRHIEHLQAEAQDRKNLIEHLRAIAEGRQQHIEFLRAEAQDRKNHIDLLYKMASGAVDARNAALKQLADERRKSGAERQQFLAIIESLTARLADEGNVDGRAGDSQ